MFKKIGIPNMISIFRIIGTVFTIIYISFYGIPSSLVMGLWVLFLALTDALDGYIARKFKMQTKLGAILDPIADKIFNWGLAISLMVAGVMPIWVLVIGLRDIGAVVVTEMMYEKTKKIFLTWPAKAKMVFQSMGLIATIFFGFGYTGLSLLAPIFIWLAIISILLELIVVKIKYFK